MMMNPRQLAKDIVDAPPEEEPESDGMEACCSDLIEAVKAGDAKACAVALKECFGMLEAEPHEEGGEESGE